MATVATRHRHPRTGLSVSIGLLTVLIVLFAVVLTFTLDNDERADRNTAPAAPLSYYAEGAGEGLIGGSQHAGVPALKAHTGEFQGEGRLNTSGGISVNRPMAHYEEGAGEGLIGGNVGLTDILPSEQQAPLTTDEMLFQEWNDPLGWQVAPAPAAVTSYEDMLFLEQNGVFTDRALAVVPRTPTVVSFDRMRFLEVNTILPGWGDDADHIIDRQRSDRY